MADFVSIIHSGSPTSLSQFVSNHLVIFNDNLANEFALLFYEGNDTRIEDNLRKEDDDAILNAGAVLGDVIRSGTEIRVPKDNLRKEVVVTAGNIVIPNDDFNAFIDDRIKEIQQGVGYTPIDISTREHSESQGSVFRVSNNVTVWVWSKELGERFGEGKIFNLTPFVQDITTSVGDNGGNFNITLAPVTCEWFQPEPIPETGRPPFVGDSARPDFQRGRWVIKKASVEQYFYNEIKNVTVRDSTVNPQGGIAKSQKYLFNNIISSNDVIFIQFETLDNELAEREKEYQEQDVSNLIVSEDKLVGKQFDMIGLVDESDINKNHSTSEVSINVTGRDCMKLLIEDGTYFYPIDFAGETGGISENQAVNEGGKDNRPFQRLVNGELQFFNAFVDRTIDFSLRFIFNLLSNVQICSNELFRFYPDKTFRYDYAQVIDEGDLLRLQTVPAAGIWQIIKLVIDEKVSERRLVDSSIRSDQGSILNYVNKACQKPFVEFYGDTYGDKYYFIARKPPYSQTSYTDLVEQTAIDIFEDDIYQESLNFSDEVVYSWYRLIPLGNFFGDESNVSKVLFPAKFFEEYAKVWGSRPLEVVSNYIDYQGIQQDKSPLQFKDLVEQSRQDLAYIIETNAYMPFVRRGTIVLKGDRRIKRGIAIRHNGTGEIYHVDSVTQTYSVNEATNDRLTSINVSRGMVEEFMAADRDINYFNIIDLDKDEKGVSKTSDFKVNKEAFNFFMRREQFRNA